MLRFILARKVVLFQTLGLLLFISSIALGQRRVYLPGYVVLADGDTLVGHVTDRKETLTGTELLEKVRFRPDNGGRKRRYRPQQLRSYQAGERTYESFSIQPRGISLLGSSYELSDDGEWVFLRVISRGRLNHYQWEWTEQDDAGVESMDLFRKENEPVLIRATQGIFGLKRKILINYFTACPLLQKAIEQRTLQRATEVVDYYNRHCTSSAILRYP